MWSILGSDNSALAHTVVFRGVALRLRVFPCVSQFRISNKIITSSASFGIWVLNLVYITKIIGWWLLNTLTSWIIFGMSTAYIISNIVVFFCCFFFPLNAFLLFCINTYCCVLSLPHLCTVAVFLFCTMCAVHARSVTAVIYCTDHIQVFQFTEDSRWHTADVFYF